MSTNDNVELITWNHTTVYKKLIRNSYTKNVNIYVQ